MKKTMKFFAMAFVAGAMFTSCGGDDDGKKEPGTGPDGGGDNYPTTVLIDKATEGEVKAGFADAISIEGAGFEPDNDYIYVGWEVNGKMEYVKVDAGVLTQTSRRVSFGVNVADEMLGHTIRVYLDRIGFDKMPLTKAITFKLPEVSEGYIPDPAFRAALMSKSFDEGNPTIAALFDPYGMISPAAAENVKKSGAPDVLEKDQYALNLYNCPAKSLAGIELFKSVEGTVACWNMGEIEVMDLSKWQAKGQGNVAIFAPSLPKLKTFIGSPNGYRFDIYKCDNLTSVDLSKSKWAYNVQLFYDESPTKMSYVTTLDMRKDRSGVEKGGPKEGEESSWKGYPHAENEYTPFLSGVWFKVADNCQIKVDYQFLVDKWTDGASGYNTIYNAWTRGAKIEVYASKSIDKKIGEVPMFSANPTALTVTGANNWTIEDK